MKKPILAVVACAGLLTACGGGGSGPTVQTSAPSAPSSSSPSGSSSPSASSSSSPNSSSSSSAAASTISSSVQTGQCLADKDSYAVVPCTQTHIYQVTAVIKDARDTSDPSARQVLRTETCNASVLKFTGGAPVGLLAVGQPVKLLDDPLNASRIVCLVHLRTGDDSANLPINYTLADKLTGANAFQYTFCVDKAAKNFKIVSCTQPHGAQSVGGYLSGRYVEKFPGRAHLVAQRAKLCPPVGRAFLGTDSRSDVEITGLFVSESAWKLGDRYAACFVQVKTGTVKKSLQGIGTKSLSSYR